MVGWGPYGGRFDEVSVEFRCREGVERKKRVRRGQEEDKKTPRRRYASTELYFLKKVESKIHKDLEPT